MNSTAEVKSISPVFPILVRKEDIPHLPPIYRALAEHLIETNDPRIKIVDGFGVEHGRKNTP